RGHRGNRVLGHNAVNSALLANGLVIKVRPEGAWHLQFATRLSGWAEAPGCVLHRRCARWRGGIEGDFRPEAENFKAIGLPPCGWNHWQRDRDDFTGVMSAFFALGLPSGGSLRSIGCHPPFRDVIAHDEG
ncbi:MAG: hypothetical protein ACKO2L_16110, partial [Planctomycetaceae bacterium]